VFVFDTWAHEGDPLRRTFLEQLIRFLVKGKCVDACKWSSKLDELSGRRKVATTTSTPNLTTWGGVFALALYVAAIGLAVLRLDSVAPISFYAAILFSLAPLLVLLVASVFSRISRTINGGTNLLGLLLNKTRETTTTEALESTEPTSVEFEACFKELMSDAALSGRKLLIAIDNLDRVDVSDAKKLWSSVRTFLEFFGRDMPLWASNVWVLIPYAPCGVSRLWGNDEGDEVVKAFLDKSFHVRFDVPAPLIPDWHGYLEDQLRAAFPDHPEDDLYRASRVFAVTHIGSEAPTPRDIKLFVNQIGSAFRTAAEDFPLPVLALHVLAGGRGWKPGEVVQQAEGLGAYVGEDWQEALAAIQFNMPRDRARHVLYWSRIHAALSGANRAELKDLLQNPGVDSMVEDLIDKNAAVWAKSDPRLIGCAAYALGDPHTRLSGPIKNGWDRLARETGAISALGALDEKTAQGFATLIRFASDPKVTATVMGAMGAWSPITGPQGAESNKRYLEGSLEILRAAEDSGHAEVIEKHFRVGTTGENYVDAAATVSELSGWPRYWRFFRPACPADDLSRSLVACATSHQWSGRTDRACAVMLTLPDSDLRGLRDILGGVLSQPQSLRPDEGAAIVRTLFRLRPKAVEAETDLRNIMRSGWGFHHLQVALEQRDWLAFSSWLLAAVTYCPDPRFGPAPVRAAAGVNTYRSLCGNPSGYEDALEALGKLTLELGTIDELFKLRDAAELPRSLVNAVLAKHAERADAWTLFPPQLIVDRFRDLPETVGADAALHLIAASLEEGELSPYLLQTGFSAERAHLYRLALGRRDSPQLREMLLAGLKNVHKDRWQQSLQKDDDLINLALELSKAGTDPALGYPLKDALVGMVPLALSNALPSHIDRQFCSSIVSTLTSDQVELLKRDVRDQVLEADRSTARALDLFSFLAEDCELLCEDPDRVVREGFRNMLGRLDSAELAWVAQVTKVCPGILRECRPATRTDFAERVADVVRKPPSDAVRPKIMDLARTLGVKTGDPSPQKKA
jgi:hypothetical protein